MSEFVQIIEKLKVTELEIQGFKNYFSGLC